MGAHEHAGHHHPQPGAPPADGGQERRVLAAMCLTGGFTVVEVVGGLLAGSLALIADAGHMLTDTGALALAWVAFKVARRPPDRYRSYGYQRFPVLAAWLNGALLVLIVLWILVEALRRLWDPVQVLAGPMLVVAVVGLLVNLIAFAVLRSGDRNNLNMRGALVHVLGDLLGSAAAVTAAVVIMVTGWTPIDPLLSVLVALLVLKSGVSLLRQAGHVLMEGAPPDLDGSALRSVLVDEIEGLDDVHHVHVWCLSPGQSIVTLHARVREGMDQQKALVRILTCLRQRFGVAHATVQIERGECLDQGGHCLPPSGRG